MILIGVHSTSTRLAPGTGYIVNTSLAQQPPTFTGFLKPSLRTQSPLYPTLGPTEPQMFGERLPPAALNTTARALRGRTSPFPLPTFSPSRDLSSPPLTEPAVLALAPHPTPPPPRTRASSPFHLTVLRHLSAGAFSRLPQKTKGTVHDRILDKHRTVSRKAQTRSRQICTAAAFPPPAKARPRF